MFFVISKKFDDKYAKRLMDSATLFYFTRQNKELKKNEKEDERQEIYTSPEKKTANYWWLKIVLNMEYQKISNLLDTAPDNVRRFITKNG